MKGDRDYLQEMMDREPGYRYGPSHRMTRKHGWPLTPWWWAQIIF
jgi:hypothetical protein